MTSKERPIKEIEMLIRNEEAVARLYKAYAEKFPGYQNLWFSIAKDEIKHAENIRKFYSKVKDGYAYFNEGRFKIEAIQTFLSYLERKLLEVRNQEFPLRNALSTGVDIENSFIEKLYSEIFEGDSIELKHTLLAISADEKGHRNKIKRALAENK